ncbi:MAG: Dabb family protein [Verrucomicrobiales bacterium]
MTKILATLIAALAFTFAMSSPARAEDAPYRHVVLFKFKDDAKKEDVEKIEKAFAALKGKIDLIKDYEWGTNVSPEGLDDGFTHCFFVTFASKADLEKYLPHPEHKAFVAQLKPVLDKALVVDYVAK